MNIDSLLLANDAADFFSQLIQVERFLNETVAPPTQDLGGLTVQTVSTRK